MIYSHLQLTFSVSVQKKRNLLTVYDPYDDDGSLGTSKSVLTAMPRKENIIIVVNF